MAEAEANQLLSFYRGAAMMFMEDATRVMEPLLLGLELRGEPLIERVTEDLAKLLVRAHENGKKSAEPELLVMLKDACESLDMCERSSATHVTADRIRERLSALLGKEWP